MHLDIRIPGYSGSSGYWISGYPGILDRLEYRICGYSGRQDMDISTVSWARLAAAEGEPRHVVRLLVARLDEPEHLQLRHHPREPGACAGGGTGAGAGGD